MDHRSDLQFIADVLRRVHTGDQITRAELHRLDEIAEYGSTRGVPLPDVTPRIVNPTVVGR